MLLGMYGLNTFSVFSNEYSRQGAWIQPHYAKSRSQIPIPDPVRDLVNKLLPRYVFFLGEAGKMSTWRMSLGEFFTACKDGDVASVRKAVECGLNVKNAVDEGFLNRTPLHHACLYVQIIIMLRV